MKKTIIVLWIIGGLLILFGLISTVIFIDFANDTYEEHNEFLQDTEDDFEDYTEKDLMRLYEERTEGGALFTGLFLVPGGILLIIAVVLTRRTYIVQSDGIAKNSPTTEITNMITKAAPKLDNYEIDKLRILVKNFLSEHGEKK